MAVREYVGARYVPRFLGTYSATTIYDALDVVDDGMGTSYIAKKTVPAGTALTDTNYWFVYGASSGAIISLQNRVTNIENVSIPELDEKIENKYYNGLHGTDILFLADSFGLVGWGDWCNYVKNKMGSEYNVTIDATAGATLTSFANKLASIPDGTYDDILMVCGTNDIYTDWAAVQDHYNYFKTYIAGKYKATRLHFGFCAVRYANAAQRALIKPCQMLYEKLCGELGMRYLGNFNKYLFPAFNFVMSDGIHPTTVGGKRLASAIGNAFCDCCEIFNDYVTYQDTANSINYDFMFDIINGSAIMKMKYTSNTSIPADNAYHNITIPSGNYQNLSCLADAFFKWQDVRTYEDVLLYYEIKNDRFRWASIGAGNVSSFDFAFTASSPVNIDSAVNDG